MKKALYVWKGQYPWDIRAEKICNSLIKNGYEVYLLSRWFDGELERENYKGINIIRAGFNKQFTLTQPISINPIWKNAIKDAVMEIKPDVIIPRDIMLAEACGKIGRKYNTPVIMDMAEHYPAAMKGWKKYYDNVSLRILVHHLNIPELVEKRAVKLMDGIITVSEELNNRINTIYTINKEKLQIVRNTPDKNFIDNIRKGFCQPIRNFAYHGHFSQDRNLETLIEAFSIAAIKDKEIKLILAGSGENYMDCINIGSKSKAKDRIIFKGKYRFEELNQLYSETDIALLPFKNNDFINHIIANKLFDYMSIGKPIIVSEAIPMKRIIIETKAGIVVDCSNPENIAAAILNIKNLNLQEMSENGIKAFKEKYNWEVDSKNMINFIERIIN